MNLFTRPRRFGKTLTQSMLRRFFELELDGDGKPIDNRYIFQNLQIASCGERYLSKQGIYPVIDLSLKSAKQPDYEMAYGSVVDEIAKEYRKHDYVLEASVLTDTEKMRFAVVRESKSGVCSDYGVPAIGCTIVTKLERTSPSERGGLSY